MKRAALVLIILAVSWGAGRWLAPPLLARTSFSREVLDRHDRLLRLTTTGDEKYRIFQSLDEMSSTFVEAVLLHEDRHFYDHPGVNPVSLVKAALHTYGGGGRRVGGSTITMQLARMTSTINSKTIAGKIQQSARALWIELWHSKREILEAYLNLLPYGGNIEGVGAASRIYFQKHSRDLTLAESLSLAVIPQSPSARQITAEISRKARERLFAAWLARHPEGKSRNVEMALPLIAQSLRALPFRAPHFVESAMKKRPTDRVLFTTLDRGLQQFLESKVKHYVRSHSNVGVTNAAAIVVDIETREVRALLGSADYFDDGIQGQVNGVAAKRSPGSTLKPFLYALALDQGLIHPATLMKDTPMSFAGFDPENFDQNFSGPVSATEALIRSRNIPAVYLDSLVKEPSLYQFLKRAQIRGLREPEFYGLALSLGGAEVSLEELARLYTMLANGGELADLKMFRNEKSGRSERMLSAESSFLVLDMLRKNPRPDQMFANDWLRDQIGVAWKTGTSHGFRDAWTVGVVGPLIVGVWLGNFDGEGNPAFVGRDLAAPLFFQLADGLKDRATGSEKWLWSAGLNVKKVDVCALSGHLAGAHCPHKTQAWFIPGKSPISTCNIHRSILISKRTGLRACDESQPGLQPRVFEFWPSDLLQVFRLAGLPRRAPPAFEPKCLESATQNMGVAPAILSPKEDVIYGMRTSDADSQVPLVAVADGDATQLFWFVGSELVGQSEPQKPLLWKSRPGKFIVRVVDDLGRQASRELIVKMSQ